MANGRSARGNRRTGTSYPRTSGFTMVEIAIAIAVIGIALVAIIGVLPTGLQVQRDNREDTIINHDGTYWMEAIRNGAAGSTELLSFVDWVADSGGTTNKPPTSSLQILGTLTTNMPNAMFPRAGVRAITGPAVDRDPQVQADIGFKYILFSQVTPFPRNTNAYEIRLIFQWPVMANGLPGSGRKVFRTVVSGHIIETNGFHVLEPNSFGPQS